jgi:hypothetical protein
MSDHDEDYALDDYIESVFADHGDEYYYKRLDEEQDKIVAEAQQSGLVDGILSAHSVASPAADAQFAEASERLARNELSCALFVAFRGLEAYCTVVFVNALYRTLTKPLPELATVVKPPRLLGDSMKGKSPYISFGLYAIAGDKTRAAKATKALNTYITASRDVGGWEVRNALFHSAYYPSPASAKMAFERAKETLDLVREPILGHLADAERALAERAAQAKLQKRHIGGFAN